MASPARSVLGSKVDRFLVGKLVFGLLAFSSLLTALGSFIRAAMAWSGSAESAAGGRSLVLTGIGATVLAVIWIFAFRWVESARQRASR